MPYVIDRAALRAPSIRSGSAKGKQGNTRPFIQRKMVRTYILAGMFATTSVIMSVIHIIHINSQ